MSMMNFAGALQGAPPQGAPADPTDLYGGGGGGGAPPDPTAGAPPDPNAGAPPDTSGGPGGQFSTSLDALDAAEEALHAFIQLDPDDGDRAVAATCLQNLLKLKAKNQQDAQGGGGMTSLARALQGPVGGQ